LKKKKESGKKKTLYQPAQNPFLGKKKKSLEQNGKRIRKNVQNSSEKPDQNFRPER